MKRRYTLSNLEESSAKYGNCEICGEPVSEVYLQREENESTYGGWTYGRTRFGHEDCLINMRKQ